MSLMPHAPSFAHGLLASQRGQQQRARHGGGPLVEGQARTQRSTDPPLRISGCTCTSIQKLFFMGVGEKTAGSEFLEVK